MKHLTSFAAICAVSALAAAPALAVSSHANQHAVENTTKTHPTPGPSASMPAKAKAYGVLCQKESKKHVAGTKGTPFSQCVNALAKVATDTSTTPSAACSTESKKHVAGTKGTPFSRCVTAAARLRASQHASSTTGS
jgi:hypothetical protein